MYEAKTVEKLIKTSVRILVNDLGAERALVVFDQSCPDYPLPAGFYGFESERVWEDESVSSRLMERVLHRGELVFLLDAQQDSDYRDSLARSVCCVPIKLSCGQVAGFLYADHSKPGFLDYPDRDFIEAMAEEFTLCYQEIQDLPPAPPTPAQESDFSVTRPLFTVLTAALLGLAIWGSYQLEPPPPTDRVVLLPVADIESPEEVAERALGAFREGRFGDLLSLSSDGLKLRLSPLDFDHWRTVHANRLRRMEIEESELGYERTTVTLGDGSGPPWSLYLVREHDRWRVDGSEPPFHTRQ